MDAVSNLAGKLTCDIISVSAGFGSGTKTLKTSFRVPVNGIQSLTSFFKVVIIN